MDEQTTTYATMDDAARRNAIIAERLMGLRPGVDWGEFPEHDWQWNEESEYNSVWCPRCYKSHDWQDWRHGVEAVRKADPGPCWDDPPDYTFPQLLAKAEAEIAQRGLAKHYVEALASDLNITAETLCKHGASALWQVLTATPDARVRAMLRALGEG